MKDKSLKMGISRKEYVNDLYEKENNLYKKLRVYVKFGNSNTHSSLDPTKDERHV